MSVNSVSNFTFAYITYFTVRKLGIYTDRGGAGWRHIY